MRLALIVCLVVSVAACANSTAPSAVSAGTTTNIAGTWNGTIASTGNPTLQLGMVLAQSGADVTGTWDSTSVSWAGQIRGTVNGASFDGQLTFSGTTLTGTVCTGTATVAGSVSGSVSGSTMTWTSASGVVGGSCPVSLPVGLKIDVQHQ